jgi:DNA-binding MarR family transcriptional regulator
MFEETIIYLIKYIEQSMKNQLYDALRELRLTMPQYVTLDLLAKNPGLSGAELARRSFVTPQTMNTIITNLEEAGLITRRVHAEFGTILQSYLTENGEQILLQAQQKVKEVERQITAALNEKERAELLKVLQNWAKVIKSPASNVK